MGEVSAHDVDADAADEPTYGDAGDERGEESRIDAWFKRVRPAAVLQELYHGHDDVMVHDLDDYELAVKDHVLHGIRPYASEYFGGVVDTEIFVELFRPRELFRVFGASGADVAPDIRRHYRYSWTDAPGGTAGTDVRTGRFWTSQYSTNGELDGIAGLGVRVVPFSRWCRLSIRPYVRFDGLGTLSGRIFDIPDRPPASASWNALIGIFVESWALDGSAHHVEEDRFIPVAGGSASNPGTPGIQRGFDGAVTTPDGLTVEVFATNLRSYRIWVYCWVEANGQSLIQATAYASTNISCWMPYLVVEEIPA